MFLPYAAVAVFAFTVNFNLLNLYTHAESESPFVNIIFSTCKMCLESWCHLVDRRPCITRYWEHYNFTCYTCKKNHDGIKQHYTEDECKAACTDPDKMCICDFECYICVPKEWARWNNWTRCNYYPVEEPTCV